MDSTIKSSRVAALALFLALIIFAYGAALFKLQVVEGEKYLAASSGTTSSTQTMYASRGSILDRNGELLVSDRTVYNVRINRTKLLKQDAPNNIILRLVKAAGQYGIEYTDTFPVTMSAPFSFSAGMTSTQEKRMEAYRQYFRLKEDISATDLIAWMRDHYKIDYTVTAEDARLIIGVRYEVELRAVMSIADYIFAQDVGTNFITYLKENNLPAVSIEASSVREYHTSYAAHVLGNIGLMTGEEYETYKQMGYSLNSYIGKNGVEYAFEEYLHGKDGTVTTYTDQSGAVVGVEVTKEASAGNNVYLTLDIGLQKVAENSLESIITDMNDERTAKNEASRVIAMATAVPGTPEDELNIPYEELAEGGAVVAIDVNSGDVLVSASYPSYDLATFGQDYSVLEQDPLNPMFNRATKGTYNPGSTFKMVTALAGLRSGVITPYTTVKDEGVYTEYEDVGFSPRCWIFPSGTHGTLNVVGALENSCNYFFYWVSDQLDITSIAETASELGLGAKTGIEIGEKPGTLASREYKKQYLGEGWWNADTLITAIGQGYNYFTPIQIANYVATIANGGTHYKTSILKYIASADYTETLLNEDPTVLNVIDDTDGYIPVLQQGMKAVASTGTAASTFKNYSIPVAAKTGTVQSDSASMNTGVFVCYAPADDPQIAIAVVVEKGGSGSALATVARDILTAYFGSVGTEETGWADNYLIK